MNNVHAPIPAAVVQVQTQEVQVREGSEILGDFLLCSSSPSPGTTPYPPTAEMLQKAIEKMSPVRKFIENSTREVSEVSIHDSDDRKGSPDQPYSR